MVTSELSGKVLLAPEPGIFVQITCRDSSLQKVALSLCPQFSCTIEGADPLLEEKILLWLRAYAGQEVGEYPLNPCLKPFQTQVLKHLQSIPFGKTLSYREVAKALNHPKAARAVGNACRSNPLPLFIPCHRIIHSNGALGGFSPEVCLPISNADHHPSIALELKRRLLRFEGHPF